ncbi:MAG TPA: hypothetical protein VJ698_24265 [Noviherbaspirillum sp.]|uniref:hypothetical protein n=1 Tax=Noviherbaspirillum sp. TaxID=1926288 RepID=UPI002B467141|nr:hypothetical protein [Noviherbaspirillum sp.]HJV88602.1 hypothetical protein [Noviherbaspirillum sp.]
MEITDAMLDAAVRKAVEAGLFARHGTSHDLANNREIMRSVLEASMQVAISEVPEHEPARRWGRIRRRADAAS